MKQKICTGCSKIKDITEFHRNKHSGDGRASHCKTCMKAYYQANKERDCANSRKYYKEQGKALRKLPKKEKQFSVNEEIYQKEHEKFFNEEFIFIIRAKWQAREYDPVARKKHHIKYYKEHKAEISTRNRGFYRRHRDEILEKAQLKRDALPKKVRAALNKKHNAAQQLKRDNMSNEEYEVASAGWRERYRLQKGGEVRPYRRAMRRKLK